MYTEISVWDVWDIQGNHGGFRVGDTIMIRSSGERQCHRPRIIYGNAEEQRRQIHALFGNDEGQCHQAHVLDVGFDHTLIVTKGAFLFNLLAYRLARTMKVTKQFIIIVAAIWGLASRSPARAAQWRDVRIVRKLLDMLGVE